MTRKDFSSIFYFGQSFKVRNNNNSFNASNENMVYMAIAEAPFKYANAR